MLRLLTFRAVALCMRPAAVLLEGAGFAGEDHALIHLIPISMLALTLTSIPVHLNYFISHSGRAEHQRLAREYISALTWMTIVSFVSLFLLLLVLPSQVGFLLALAICFAFLTEKFADEASRALEFRKAFAGWFLVQLLRSGWLFVPIAASMAGLAYVESLLICSILACVLMFLVFLRVTDLFPNMDPVGLTLIRTNAVFLVGSVLPALFQQMPRIIVTATFPAQAHIFLAMAQLAQGLGLIMSVRLQIPYRKISARRPKTFERLQRPVMVRFLVPIFVVALSCLLLSFVMTPHNVQGLSLVIILAPIIVANALTFSILSSYLGYIPWFASKRSALETYVICISVVVGIVAVLVGTGLARHISVISIPALTSLIGLLWLHIIKRRYFSQRTVNV